MPQESRARGAPVWGQAPAGPGTGNRRFKVNCDSSCHSLSLYLYLR